MPEAIVMNNFKTEDLDKKQHLRIAIFTASYAPFLDGISLSVQQRVRWLLQQGHEVFLIHPEINDKYPESIRNRTMPGLGELQSFPCFSSYAYPTKPLVFCKSIPEPLHYRHWNDTNLLKNFRPNIVVVEEPGLMIGFYSLFWRGYGRPVGTEYAKQTGTPTIALFHTDGLAYARSYVGNWFIRCFRQIISALAQQCSKAYDVIYFSSWELLVKYRAMKVQNSQYLAFQGVNCQNFHPKNICYDPILGDRRPTLVFVGRIAPEKNVTQLLDAFPIIAASIPAVHLVIVGSGPSEQKVRQRAAKFGSSITVWGESLGTELLGWYARADVFVNPSVTENFCTTNMEALASETPVVAAYAGGNIEQIVHGSNGFLAKPNNPRDLAQKVIAILRNPTLKQEMARQARQSAIELHWLLCMQRFEDKLYRLVGASNKSEVSTTSPT